MSKFFNLNMEDIGDALAIGVIAGVVAVIAYIVQVGDVFKLNFQDLVNAFVFGSFGIVVGVLKNILTTSSGKFAGVIPTVPSNTSSPEV